jgi:hypothetical protein
MASLWRIIKIIDRWVRGGESWHAAWEAVKEESRENWPDFLPYIGASVLAVWSGFIVALPFAITVGLVGFAAFYTIRVMRESNSMRSALIACLDIQTNILAMLLMKGILERVPQLNPNPSDIRDLHEYIDRANRFIQFASARLSNTTLATELQSAIILAKNAGRAEVGAVPHSERPKDIDPLIILTFCETRHALEATIRLLNAHINLIEQSFSTAAETLKKEYRGLKDAQSKRK